MAKDGKDVSSVEDALKSLQLEQQADQANCQEALLALAKQQKAELGPIERFTKQEQIKVDLDNQFLILGINLRFQMHPTTEKGEKRIDGFD